MTDNTVKSEDVNPTPKKATAKKAAPKKTITEPAHEKNNYGSNDLVVVVFESGSSYSSGEVRFTRENPMQEVTRAVAEQLLQLENFGLPNQIELEAFYASRGGK